MKHYGDITKIHGWDLEPVDVVTGGKTRQTTDSARYKALGNSIALPYWKVLARRISSHYDRDITIGSLFDGIGGFPLAFEHCGGKAIWASEIEEFPIAVTKRRFPEPVESEEDMVGYTQQCQSLPTSTTSKDGKTPSPAIHR